MSETTRTNLTIDQTIELLCSDPNKGAIHSEIILDISSADADALGAIYRAISQQGDATRFEEHATHPNHITPQMEARLRRSAELIALADRSLGHPGSVVGEFDGTSLKVELAPSDKSERVRALREILSELRQVGIGVCGVF